MFFRINENDLTELDLQRAMDTLHWLEAARNELVHWPDLSFAKDTVEYVDLSHNKITALNFNDLQKLSKLYDLYLEHNLISSIIPFADDTIKNFLSLSKLYIHNNELKHIPDFCNERFRNLAFGFTLEFYENKFECTSCFIWLLNCPNIIYDFFAECTKSDSTTEMVGHLTTEELENIPCDMSGKKTNNFCPFCS